MTRQIEINFYADVIADDDKDSIASDLFGVTTDAKSGSMHLDNGSVTDKTVSIDATVDDEADNLFNDE